MKKFSIAPLFLAPFLACGGGGGGTHVTVDGHTGSGSGSGSGSAAPCTASATYDGNFGSAADQLALFKVGSGSAVIAPGRYEEWDAFANNDTNPDAIYMQLFKGYGAMTAGIVPGTYPITGDDSQYMTCGLCVLLATDTTQTSYSDDYLATSGTVTLTSVGSGSGVGSGSNKTYGTFAGTFSGVKFEHVNIGSDTVSTPVGDCTSMLASGTFSADVTYGGGGSGSAALAPVALHVHWDRAPKLGGRHY